MSGSSSMVNRLNGHTMMAALPITSSTAMVPLY